jgi:hypothetical protein
MASNEGMDFSERLSRKVLASLRSLNQSLGEVRSSVAKIDSIAHQRLTISSPNAARTGEESFTSAVATRVRGDAPTTAALDQPTLKRLLLSPGLRGAGLDEGVLDELRRVLDPEAMAAVLRHVESKPSRSKDARASHTPPPAEWHSPSSGNARSRGKPALAEGGGESSEDDAPRAGAATHGDHRPDGEDASEDQTLAQARRYRLRTTRTDAPSQRDSGGAAGPTADDDDSDASADMGQQPLAQPSANSAVTPHRLAAAAPLPPANESIGQTPATSGPQISAVNVFASAMDQRQRIVTFQAAIAPASGRDAALQPDGSGAISAEFPARAPVLFSFPRYSDPPADAIEDDGEEDDVPVTISEIQEVSSSGIGRRSSSPLNIRLCTRVLVALRLAARTDLLVLAPSAFSERICSDGGGRRRAAPGKG